MKNAKDLYAHGGNIYEIRCRYGADVIDFSANINPLGIPLRVKKLLSKKTDILKHYPDAQAQRLKVALARYWNVEEENVLVGNGSTELIYLILNAFQPACVTIPVPSFTEYERAARIAKSKIKFIHLLASEGFRLKPTRIKDCDTLFLCNPNNPTGNLIIHNRKDIENLPAKRIIMDESFMDFLSEEKAHTLIAEAKQSKKIIVLRTFTKFFALAGLRVGYAIAHKHMVQFLQRFQMPWSVNALAQAAAEYALSEKEHIRRSRQAIEKERIFLYDAISRLKGFKPYPSVANFLLIEIENSRFTSTRLKERLLRKGILIRDCANFRGLNERFVRMAVRTHKENISLIKALEEIYCSPLRSRCKLGENRLKWF
jgi:threonine-phosphate decarboxylase